MCHYVTAVLPKSAAHHELDALAREHGRQFQPLSNPSIEAQIGPEERYFISTLGHCDCGTPLGALVHGASRAPDWSSQEQRLRQKGWSKARIARAITQKQAAFRSSAESSTEANLKAMSSWLKFIGAILGSGKTSHLGLLLHMYSGSVSSRIALVGREVVRSTELTPDLLGHMKEDVLYVFTR